MKRSAYNVSRNEELSVIDSLTHWFNVQMVQYDQSLDRSMIRSLSGLNHSNEEMTQ